MTVFCIVQCMRYATSLAQLPMSHDPLFPPLPHCHIESNGALMVEVQRIDTVGRVGRVAAVAVWMEWVGAVGACCVENEMLYAR